MIRDQKLWTWHVAAGLAILFVLGLHMIVVHLDEILGIYNAPGTEPVAWSNVVMRARMPLFLVTYLLLLGAALFHGLYGARNIVFELRPPDGIRKATSIVLLLLGLGLLVLGIWAAVTSFSLARAL